MSEKAHHQVNIIRVTEVRKHPNADKLAIVPIEGYQAVVGLDQFKVGDLAYYIPPDSIVPDRTEFAFLWGNATYEGGTPVKKRRIGAKKLRGEWSEGVLMPVENSGMNVSLQKAPMLFSYVQGELKGLCVKEGDDIAEFLGITHYDPPEPGENTAPGSNEGNLKSRKFPRSIRGWISLIKSWLHGERREGGVSLPTYDVDAFKKFQDVLQPGEEVMVTEKIHGSNARFVFKPGIFGFEGRMYAGSRNLWKAPGSSCAWRRALKDNIWIEQWCRQNPNYALYGEITPTQKGFDYGSNGFIRFFLFDIRRPDGKWMEVDDPNYPLKLKSEWVPYYYRGSFDLETIKKLVDGPSRVSGAKHIREGIVIKAVPERTVRGLGRVQLKIVSNDYLAKSIKDGL